MQLFWRLDSRIVWVKVLRTNFELKTAGLFKYVWPILPSGVKDRSSHRRCSVRKDVLRNFAKFTGRSVTLLKKRLWHWCFPLNFAKFLRTPFYRTPPSINTSIDKEQSSRILLKWLNGDYTKVDVGNSYVAISENFLNYG